MHMQTSVSVPANSVQGHRELVSMSSMSEVVQSLGKLPVQHKAIGTGKATTIIKSYGDVLSQVINL